MTDEATRKAILARRARFLAAALAATFPAEGCKREGDVAPDEAEGTKGQKPQACLKTDERPTEEPRVCLKVAPPRSDAEPIPHPCLSVAIPNEDWGGADAGLEAGVPLPPAPSVEVKGSTEAIALVSRNRWRFRRCQAKALAIDPKAAGAVIVAIEIGEAGKPKDVKGSGASTELAKCTSEVLGALTFTDAPGTKLTVTVTYPKG
jgi:hypothetical protein